MKRYKGDELAINERPCGCEIMTLDSASAVIVRSPKDARAIIESLGRYIDSCGPAKSSNNNFNLTTASGTGIDKDNLTGSGPLQVKPMLG